MTTPQQQPNNGNEEAKQSSPKTAKRLTARRLAAKILKGAAWTVGGVIALFLLLATLIYLPPVQNFIKNRTTEYLSRETGMTITIDKVRLSFPLDLLVGNMTAVEGNDTVAAAGQLLLDIKMLPLLSGKVDLNGFELRQAKLNSKDFISDIHIVGGFGLLAIDKPALCNLETNEIDVNAIRLKDANVRVELSDTAKKDTTPSAPSPWRIRINDIKLQNTAVRLQMPGDSMRVGADIEQMKLHKAFLDLKNEVYEVGEIGLASRNVAYDIPYQPKAAATKACPNPLDFNHLSFEQLGLKAKDFKYANKALDLNLLGLVFKEKSGLTVNKLAANVHYDSTRVNVADAVIQTPNSELSADIQLPFSALGNQGYGNMEAKLKGSVGKSDINILAGGLPSDVMKLLPNDPIDFNLRAEGSMADLTLDYCNVTLPGIGEVRTHGTVRQLLADNRNGNLHYTMELKDSRSINGMIPASLRQTIRIPSNVQIGGDLSFSGNKYTLDDNAIYYGGGKLSFSGSYSASNSSYSARLKAQRFPLHAFLPSMPLSPLTASFDLKGSGTNFLSSGTNLTSMGTIANFAYDGIPLDKISFDAQLRGPKAIAKVLADNSWLKGDLNVEAAMSGHETTLALRGDIHKLALNMGKTPADSSDINDLCLIMGVDLQASLNDQTNAIAVAGDINPLNAVTSTMGFPGCNLHVDFATDDHNTNALLTSGDMVIRLDAPESLNDIISGYSNYAANMAHQFTTTKFDTDTLKTLLPELQLSVRATGNNPVQQFMGMEGYSFDSLFAQVNTGKAVGINADIDIRSFQTGSVLLERSTINITQGKDRLKLHAFVKNSQRNNPNKFSAAIDGEMFADGVSVLADFTDAQGQRGLNIGARASFSPHGDITLNLIPEESTIAYRKFKVNKDNFITIDSCHNVTADVSLLADDNTALKLFSMPTDSTGAHDLTLSIAHLSLRDLSDVIPFMPQMGGFLTGDIHMVKKDDSFTAVAGIETKDLEFEGTAIGTLGAELFYMPEDGGHYVVAQILSGNDEIAVLDGHYGVGATDKLDATLTFDHLPCKLFNPLMGSDGTLEFSGDLDGEISVTGPLDRLAFNGRLQTDSTHVYSELYGFDLAMEDKAIDIADNSIQFKDMAFYSKSKDAMLVNGDINFSDFSNMVIDLKVKAKDYEIINARKTKKSMVFGNVFIDLDATIKGKHGLIVLMGDMKVLEKTNVTYVMTDTPLQVEDQFNGLVEFTNFTEPQEEEEEAAPVSGTFMNLKVSIDELASLHCQLSADGKSYVDCKGGGDLTLRMFPSGEMALNGRFNIDSGEMKYTLPFIPLKTFTFTEGNYIVFNGEPSNPTLNITAMEKTKASVSDDNGATRMVTFNVGVAITRQLSDMGLEFLIEAPEDLEVQNELATLSSDTKTKLAITMLATGMYASTSNKSGFKATNALNAFLESEIQNITGSALKSVDFSVGIEGNTTATGETQTDYTFQFSKKLWNDRVTFILGGKVSTGGTEDNSSTQSFIDNISLEYRLDKANSRYLRIFYDNDNYDPLEGRYSSGGAGYILRRKTNNFGDLLIFRKKNK